MPEQEKLPMNMQLPICQGCLSRGGEMQFMSLIVGRDFADDHAMYWYSCKRCGTDQGPYQCPLYWLSASDLGELEQLQALDNLDGAPTRAADCSPPARMMLDRIGKNPYLLAEAGAQAALELGRERARAEDLAEQLAAHTAT